MSYNLTFVDQYFQTARERYQIKLYRDNGMPREGWTRDPHFKEWRFCQVHREDDKTTVWLRNEITKELLRRRAPIVRHLESTVIFRWFNRIETGQIIKDLLILGWDTAEARERLKDVHPVVTGAYIIKAGDGVSKLEGILNCIDAALPQLLHMLDKWHWSKDPNSKITLKEAWEDLKTIDYLGGFMAYELVSDLRWTPVLDQAVDIMTWANAGPGCARGLGWVVAEDSSIFNCGPGNQKIMLELMQQILELSKNSVFWPAEWKPWEMREVEHWSCEFDKYKRAESGDRLKRRFTL